jgi:enoyl-CoA hydratase/carnithine racemase
VKVKVTDMEFETLLYREDEGIAYVTMNRPEVQNCFNMKMIEELAAVWEALRWNDDVRVAILTGAGDQAFCTGFDRSEIPFDHPWDPYTYDDPGLTIGPRAARLWKPVIGAVNGTAAAGAFYLLGQVDFLIAAEHATFLDPHVTYTMPAVFESIEMVNRIPFGEAMRMALMGTSERVSARRAYEIGLVTEVVPGDELLEAATRAARSIVQQPADAVMATLRTLWAAKELSPAQATALGNTFLHLGVNKERMREGDKTFASGERPKPRIR